MSRFIAICLIFIFSQMAFTGCKHEEISAKKIESVKYTVEDVTEIPSKIEEEIVNKRNKKFSIVYKERGEMYIGVGYGKQNTGGYSIKVNDVYVTENAICVDTTLIGPNENELVLKAYSYPYIILKIKETNKKVIFI